MKNLIPWNWRTRRVPVTRDEDYSGLHSLHYEMNRLFSDFLRGMDVSVPMFDEEQLSRFTPKIDLKETQDQLIISAEVAGMKDKDLEVSICGGTLTISGEKKEDKEEDVKGYYRMERSYGAFRRSIPLPQDVEADKAEAVFEHGVLKVTLPKTKQTKTSNSKPIAIKNV
jgi:HSP20 family protein